MSETTIKTTQEQATASWISYLNYLRFCELTERLANQDINIESALKELNKLKDFVAHPEHILGNPYTKHGEIAERAQVYVSNALNLVDGAKPEYEIDSIPRLDKADYLYNGRMVQSKFCYGLAGSEYAINSHLETYPDFLKEEGFYIISKNSHEGFMKLYEAGERNLLQDPSELKYYELIKEWETQTGFKFPDVVKSSRFTYDDVQPQNIQDTIQREENNILEKDDINRDKIHQETAPNLNEGIKVTAYSAAIEGGFGFALSVYKKHKQGIKLAEYTIDDWKDVGLDTICDTAKGGVRGATVYWLTNYASTPAPVASALVTATFGVMSQALQYREGIIDAEQFLNNSEVMCLDVSVSTISSIIGQTVIPIPVLGTIIGNSCGMFMLSIAKTYLSDNEQQLIEEYYSQIQKEVDAVSEENKKLLIELQKKMEDFDSLVELAFDRDVNIRFQSSVERARVIGVSEDRILHNKHEIDAFFTDNKPIEI